MNRIPLALSHLLITAPAAIQAVPALIHAVLAFFTPESGGSPNANNINSLYKIILVIALVIFVAVIGGLCYAMIVFRARKGATAHQTHGNTRLEIGWTSAAAVILVGLAILTFLRLGSIQNPPNSDAAGANLTTAEALESGDGGADGGKLYATATQHLPPNGKSLEIEVIGKQFVWQFVYPGANERNGLGAPYSYEELVVPTKTTVTLNIVSQDVVHSWWVPQLGGKFQAVPGYHNYTWFKIEHPGIFRGQCAVLCGRGHARMIATVRAIPPAQFEAWLVRQKQLIAEANHEAAIARAKLNSQVGAGQVENP